MGSRKKYLPTQMDSTTDGINFYCFLFTCMFLFFAMGASSNGTVQNFLTNMATSSDEPNYKDINITAEYKSDPNYDPNGLDWLYSITKSFMNLILEEAMPKDVITIRRDNQIEVSLDGHVSDILSQYAYVVAICLTFVVFALAMLVAGLCFTCSCCCCCCCSRASHNEKGSNTKKICLISLLIVCGALITFAGVCAFQANSRLHEGIEEFPEGLRKSIEDVKTFVDTTIQQINILLGDNFKEFTVFISGVIDDCSKNVQDGVDEIAKKMKVDEIFSIADTFVGITGDIEQIKTRTEQSEKLVKSLGQVKNDALNSCPSTITQCDPLRNTFEKLTIPDVDTTSLFQILDKVSGIQDKLKNARKAFDDIKSSITSTVDTSKKTANDKIEKAGDTIKEKVDKIADEMKKLEDNLPNTQNTRDENSTLYKVQNYIDTYDSYRHYVGLAICCVIFSIVGLLAVGMVCGFGRNNFLTKGGNHFLLCGTSLIFYFTIVIAAVSLIYFVVGIVAQQAVCKSLREPSESRFFQLVDKIDLGKYGLDINISSILGAIRSDESAYNVFDLKSQFDLDRLDDYLDDLKNALNDVENIEDKIHLDNFVMLSSDQIKTLKAIEEPDFSIVHTFLSDLKGQITTKVIDDIMSPLKAFIDYKDPELKDIVDKLQKVEKDLETKQGEIEKLPQSISNMEKVLNDLEVKIKLGSSSFKSGKDNLIDMIDNAQKDLKTEGPKKIQQVVGNLRDETLNVCTGYLQRVKNKTRDEVGKCGPIGDILDATLVSVCDKVALQMNSFWFVLLWTMLLFLPTVVVSIKLASLYKSEASYKPSLDEHRRTRRADSSKRRKTKKTRGNTEPSFVTDGNADMIYRDGNDLSLDKWDQYPSSSQPHNSRTPEEYTRPPPYFFNNEPESPKFGTSQPLYNEINDLSKWKQYPEGKSFRNPTHTSSTRF